VSFVYAFVTQDIRGIRFAKLGRSIDPTVRRADISCGCPIPIEFLLLMRTPDVALAKQVEAALHVRFAGQHSSGEWFTFGEDYQNEIFQAMRAESAAAHFTGRPYDHPLPAPTVRNQNRQRKQSTIHAVKGKTRIGRQISYRKA